MRLTPRQAGRRFTGDLLLIALITATAATGRIEALDTGTTAGRRELSAVDGTTCSTDRLEALADHVATEFQTHDFVFIGSTHGDVKVHQFLMCLVTRPELHRHAPDILVEFATPLHQAAVDRYVLDLGPTSHSALRPAWFDTDNPRLWATVPGVPAFFELVREVNQKLPHSSRLRILGGNEPVDWSRVMEVEQLAPYPYKTNLAAHLLTKHLAPDHRKVLVVYGERHNYYNGGTLMTDILVDVPRDRMCVIGTVPDAQAGQRPLIERLGDPAEPFYLDTRRIGRPQTLPAAISYAEGAALDAAIDRILYLGPAPDANESGRIPLSSTEAAEADRRARITANPLSVRIRLGNKNTWFEGHPYYHRIERRTPTMGRPDRR